MTAVLAAALTPVLKVLGKAAGKLAHRLHREEFHRYAEECKRRDIEAGYDHFKSDKLAKVIILAALLSCSGCASLTHAWRVGFVHAHEAIDEALNDKTEQQTAP